MQTTHTSKKILFVLMPFDYQDVEFTVPYDILTNDRHQIDVAGFGPERAIGSQGHEHKPNLLLEELSPQDLDAYDAIVIPGGVGSPEYLWDNEQLQDIVRYFYERKKVVAAICYACIVPVQAEILRHKHATVYPTDEAKAILAEHDVIFKDEPCIVLSKERIITAQGPHAAKTFSEAILNLIS